MAKYFIQDTTLTNIANAIREKAGITTSLFPENMPSYIRSIETGSSDAPDYIVAEVDRVVNDVIAVQNANTFTFPVTSDIHYSFDSIPDDMNSFTDDISYALGLIRNRIYPDFEADMGDKVFGATSYTDEDTCGEATVINDKLGYSAVRMNCLGNHDLHNTTKNQRYALTCFYNQGAVYGDELNGYCYRDLENANTRIILLNTSETGDNEYSSSISMSTTQLKWLCTVLAEMTSKSGYHILFMSHMPPDWGVLSSEHVVLKILKAYETGSSYTIDGTTFDFSATNRADVIGWCHGHLHNHKTRYIEGTEVWRFCIPSACKSRANEYSNTTNYPDENFQELFGSETITKSDYIFRTATSTAFSIVVVDVAQKCINIINYGAGGSNYNRVITYGDSVTYTITNNLTNVTNSNSAETVVGNSKYTATISPNSGYEVDSITVTMGGSDVTSTVVSGNNITISSITGDIVITATAKATTVYNVTNLVPLSEQQNSTAIYGDDNNNDGVADGYRNGVYASESSDGTDSAYVTTGWIPYTWSPDNVIYIRGADVTTASHCRFYGYNTKTHINQGVGYTSGSNVSTRFTIERPEGDNVDYYKLTPTSTASAVTYIRISLAGTGENLIITVNEPIVISGGDSGDDGTETITYTVANNLTKVSSNNSATSVESGASYSATLTANDGYTMDSATVTMGGSDVTSSVYSNNVITISSVTGDIVITATAKASSVYNVTNLVTTSQVLGGAGIYGEDYNGDGTADGYKNGVYASSNGGDSTDSSCVSTGFIPYEWNTSNAIYIRGAIVSSTSHVRFYGYNTISSAPSSAAMCYGSSLSTYFTVEELESGTYYKLTPTSNKITTYIRISLIGTGENLIITVNEPIV